MNLDIVDVGFECHTVLIYDFRQPFNLKASSCSLVELKFKLWLGLNRLWCVYKITCESGTGGTTWQNVISVYYLAVCTHYDVRDGNDNTKECKGVIALFFYNFKGLLGFKILMNLS